MLRRHVPLVLAAAFAFGCQDLPTPVDSTEPARTATPLFDNDQGGNDQGEDTSIPAGCYAHSDPAQFLGRTDLEYSGKANQVDNIVIHASLDGGCSAPAGPGFVFTLVTSYTDAEAAQRACVRLDESASVNLNDQGYPGFPSDAWICWSSAGPDAAATWTTAEGNRKTAYAFQALFSPLNGQLRARLAVGLGIACNFSPALPDLTGKIALISRGACRFDEKFVNAENAGAVGVIVYNNVPLGNPLGGPISMSGFPITGIPGVNISLEDGTALEAASPRRVTLSPRQADGQNSQGNDNAQM